MVMAMVMIKCSSLEKKKQKNKMAQGKGIFDRSILFCHLRQQVGVSGFRMDSHLYYKGTIQTILGTLKTVSPAEESNYYAPDKLYPGFQHH
jgi:hypothetical protein